jgi:PAS domain S-box-containing protein
VVGVKAGDAAVDFLRNNGVDTMLAFPNYESVVRAAGSRKVAVFVADGPPALYFLHKFGLQDAFRQSAPLYAGEFHRAVAKGNAALLKAVEDGFALITPREDRAISDKWHGVGNAGWSSLRWLVPAAAGIALILLFLAVWNRALQNTVRRRTAELGSSEQRQRNAQEQLAATLDALPDFLFEVDRAGRIHDYRAPNIAALYVPPASFMGRRFVEVLPPDASAVLEAGLAEAAARGRHFGGIYRLPMPEGERWFELSIARKNAAATKDPRFIVLVRDVSPRVLAEQARRAGEIQMRHVLGAANCLLWHARVVKRDSGGFDWHLYVPPSDLYRKLFGADPGDPPELDWKRLEVAEVDSMHANYVGAMTSGAPGYEQEFHAIVGGRKIWLREQVSIAATRGREWELVGVITDITERKGTEATLRESESRLAGIIESAMDAIVTADETGTIVVFNHAAEEIFRCPAGEAIGRSVERFIPGKSRDVHKAWLVGKVGQKEVGQEFRAVSGTALRADGEEFPVEASVCSIEVNGRPLFTVILRDMTERVRAEAARKTLEEQVLLSQRLESVGRLAGGIAHDLNNILTPVLLGVPMLRDASNSPDVQETLDAMEISAKRGAAIIRQLLTFSRGGGGEHAPVQLTLIVRDMCAIIRETFPKNIVTKTDFPPVVWTVNGNRTQLHQVLMNLCVNARDAMSAGGTLSLVLENVELDEEFAAMTPGINPGPHVLLSVTDTGVGIPPEVLDKIFDPFFTTKDVGRGTGLGLSTVVGIAKSHGGIVRVTSRIGEGTQFRIYLPAVPGSRTRAETRLPFVPSGQGELILVVDDEVAVRMVTRKALEKHNYRVVEAADGREAIARFTENRETIAAVVTDLLMPVLDGPSFIRELRRLGADLPVIAASGHVDGAGLSDDEMKQVQAILPKPYLADELLFCLRGVLHSKPKPGPADAAGPQGAKS